MTTAIIECSCREPVRSASYYGGQPSRNCMRCSRTLTVQPWHLTADAMRSFFADCEEAAIELTHDEVSHFASRAITRALDLGAPDYGLHGFLKRDLRGEPEDEQLDSANYAIFQSLKDRYAVERGEMDPIKADEDYRRLLSLTVQTLKLHSEWERFWASR